MTNSLDLLLDIDDKLTLLGTRLANAAPVPGKNTTATADWERFVALRQKIKADINRVLASELDEAEESLEAATRKLQPVTQKLNQAIATINAAASGLDIASQVLNVLAEVAVRLAAL
jgi:ABC-type transporter Mla subunit MlaD